MYKLIRPILFKLDPEQAHGYMMGLCKMVNTFGLTNAVGQFFKFSHPALETKFLGINFKNPVGLAACFDKNGDNLNFLSALGFGHIEMGNITALPRPGNPKPRLFRLPEDKALINRLGLNNIGADAIFNKFKGQSFKLPIGINIAKTHDPNILGDKAVEDFVYTFKKLHGMFAYTTLNISCPNTTEGKTFEEPDALNALLGELMKVRSSANPILVKISPDVSLEELDKILVVCEQYKIDGYVFCNTAKFRGNLKTNTEILEAYGKGGISGRPLREKVNQLVSHTYKTLKRPCIVGLGGIDSAESAYERIKAGSSLIQIYTGLIYEGPGLVKQINQGLIKLLERDGFKNISEAVGVGAK